MSANFLALAAAVAKVAALTCALVLLKRGFHLYPQPF